MIYGYCRISTIKQNIERQERNILTAYPKARILREEMGGLKLKSRTVFMKLLDSVQFGDTIVFDEASRMSRNAKEGVFLYELLMKKGVDLVFLKQPIINTANMKAVYKRDDVYYVFRKTEEELTLLHQRTKEGIETARLNGKQIGGQVGRKVIRKKSIKAKAIIHRHSKDFDGTLTDVECLKLTGLSRNTYYKYKRELREEILLGNTSAEGGLK